MNEFHRKKLHRTLTPADVTAKDYPCSTTHMLTSKKLKRHGKSRTLQLMPTVIGVSTKAGL